ncbi:MAG: hypothetical protein IT462_02420 [Planctomycetes bacterium]|nr:hypothetical protein [Planctomycetota bacterium]
MKTRLAFTLALAVIAATPLLARERQPGDYAPRNSLAYVRIENLGAALTKMAGDDFEVPLARWLATAPEEDYKKRGGLVFAEFMRFARHARKTEIGVADVMVRAPHAQLVIIIDLADNAPKEFSKDFVEFAAKMGDKSKATPTNVTSDMFCLSLFPGMMAVTTTPALMQHVNDVREGRVDESLSETKRFQGWSKSAKGELVMFADMRAFRSALDRLGRDAASKPLEVLEALEWHRWDYLSIYGEFPGRTDSQVHLSAQMILTEPWGSLGFMMKPAGSFSLHRRLPREIVMMAMAQLGNDHKKTLIDTLSFFHDQELGRVARECEGEIERCKRRIDEIDKSIAGLKDDAKDEREKLETEKKAMQAQLDAAQKRLEDSKSRPFEPSKESRLAAGITDISGSERTMDGLLESLKGMELDLDQVLAPLGGELAVGNIMLPGASLGGMDSNYCMFAAVQTRTDVTDLKDKILAFIQKMEQQGRSPDHIQRQWWVTRHVQGGDILCMRGGWQSQCVFIGDGILGFAGCEDVAVRVLAASAGNGALPHARIPNAEHPGSKVFYMDLMEVLALSQEGRRSWDNQPLRVPGFQLNVRKLLRSGLRLTVSTDEQTQSLGLHGTLSGDLNLRTLLDEIASEAEFDRARRHDDAVLSEMRRACDAWLQAVRPKLSQLKPDELKKALAEVTLESLEKDGHLKPYDGLRSAFDPLLADRFQAMLAKRGGELGPRADARPEDASLAECGYAWFGVPPDISTKDIEPPPEEPPAGRSIGIGGGGRGGRGIQYDVWMVCAQHGSWARKGRLALLHADGGYQTAYLTDDQFNALRLANGRGERLVEVPTPADPPSPEWRQRIEVCQQLYGVCEVADRILELKKNGDIKSYSEAAFRGADYGEKADAELQARLKTTAREGGFGSVDAEAIEIIPSDDGFRIRFTKDGLWVEIASDNTLKTSWDE